jgi:hypothetical protein
MSDEMSIETRTAKSIEHPHHGNAVQRRPRGNRVDVAGLSET